jgi:hypothetical protein
MRAIVIVLIASLFGATTVAAFEQEATQWQKVAVAIPLGTKVKIQTADGKRLTGTLMGVNETAVTIKRNARQPEPPAEVTFDRIANLERDNGGGISVAKAIGIGLAAGAGVVVTLIVIALQIDD